MSPSRNRRSLRRSGMPIVPVLSLLLGLCLHPLSSGADVAPTLNNQAAQANRTSAPAAPQQQVASATAATKQQPAVKATAVTRASTPTTPQQPVATAAAKPQPAVKATPITRASTATPPQQPVAPATAATRPQPAVSAAPKSTLAASAGATVPPKPVRPAKRKAQPNLRMRQAVAQVADERAAEKRAEKIRDLLARAQLDYSEGRVFEPTDNNAAARYKEVLTLDPAQPQALAATQRIADILATEAQNVALAGDAPRTLQYMLQIRALQPKHPSLQGLEARYQALLANPVVLSARQQDRYRGSAERIDDAYVVLRNQPASKLTMDRVISRYDRAKKLVSVAPGLPKLEDRIIIAFPAAVRAELAADEPRRAYSLVQTARKRGWLSDELTALEEQAKKDIRAKQLFAIP